LNWITVVELALIHERVIEETGGIHGVTNPGGLESALARPFTAFGGVWSPSFGQWLAARRKSPRLRTGSGL